MTAAPTASSPCNIQPGDWYDAAAAEHAVNFIENYCSHVKAHTGRFTLEQWQKDDIIRPLFGWRREDGRRKYRTCYVEIPRKNGKSSLTAAIALYLLVATKEQGAEIISAAGDAAQARIVFETAVGMVHQSRTLSKSCRVTHYAIKYGAGFYKSISAEAKTKHGFNCSGVIFDELHVCTRDLWDVLTTSVGARREPLIMALTTAGHDRTSICWEQHEYALGILSGQITDPTYLPVIYAAGPDDDWRLESTWRKANPGYGSICQADYFQDQLIKAQQNPSAINTFKRLNLNIWTNAEEAWIADEEWQAAAGPMPDDEYLATLDCYAGLDLASTRDLCALALLWVEPDESMVYLRTHHWCNSATALNKKSAEGVDYVQFEKEGTLTITHGNTTDHAAIKEYILEQHAKYNVKTVAFDRMGAHYIITELDAAGVWTAPFGQGYYEMSTPTKSLEAAIISGKLRHEGTRCMRWQIGSAIVTHDPAANVKIVKNRNKKGQMVDGVVASVMAFGEYLKNRDTGATLEIVTL